MRSLSRLTSEEARAIDGLLFDLDDTLLTHGVLERAAFEAMHAAKDAGLLLVALTGRPLAWGEVLARQWPLEGVVVENGALAVVRDGPGVRVIDPEPRDVRAERRAALLRVKDAITSELPALVPADDAWSRVTDTTWDIGEKRHEPKETIARAVGIIAAHGATTFVSSVHLHASFDRTDKAQGAVRFLRERLGRDEGSSLSRFAFAGDSANDASCFAAFRASFGVANVKRHVARLSVPPRYVAAAEMGKGFAEIVAAILTARS